MSNMNEKRKAEKKVREEIKNHFVLEGGVTEAELWAKREKQKHADLWNEPQEEAWGHPIHAIIPKTEKGEPMRANDTMKVLKFMHELGVELYSVDEFGCYEFEVNSLKIKLEKVADAWGVELCGAYESNGKMETYSSCTMRYIKDAFREAFRDLKEVMKRDLEHLEATTTTINEILSIGETRGDQR